MMVKYYLAENQEMKTPFSSSVFIYITACLILFLSPLNAQKEITRPLITNYSYHDYNAGPINWWAIEDDRGIMYFANALGVLEYDGANWTIIKSPNENSARSLAKDKDGIIYAGFIGDIGYLKPDDRGIMRFISLKEKLPEEHRIFQDVWETDYWHGDIYYRTTEKLFRWDGKKMYVITSSDDLHVGNIVHDKYYLRVWNRGLCVLEGDSLRIVPGGEQFADERIYSILPYDDERLLIGTRDLGMFIYDGESFSTFKTEADPYLKGEQYLPGLEIGDGRFVLNTFGNGAFVIDSQGKLLQKINKDNGLQDNSVTFVYLDSRGVLWMPLFNGISSINLNSQFSYVNESLLPPSLVFTMIRHNGILYAGCNSGIHYFDEESGKFEPIQGTFGQATNFIQYDDRLYCGSGGMGFFEIIGKKMRYVRQSINYDFQVGGLAQSKKDNKRIYVNSSSGVASLYFDENSNQFREESISEKFHLNGNSFVEDSIGKLWIQGAVDGTVEVITPNIKNDRLDLTQSTSMIYDTSQGLPGTPIGFREIDGEIDFFSNKKTYGFDADSEMFHEKKLFYEDIYDPDALFYARAVKDEKGRYWFNPGKGITISERSAEGARSLTSDPFMEINNHPIYTICLDDKTEEGNSVAWFAGPDGVIRYEGSLESPTIPPFHLNMRSLSMGEDSLLYGGGNDVPDNIDISHENNTVSLGYATPFYIGEEDLEYQTMLTGLNDNWSSWSNQTKKEYINLPSGDYTFQVRAKNMYGTISDNAEFSFAVSPPWYATWWAYLLYFLGLATVIYAIVRNRTNLLRERQKELEEKVHERTQEVEQRIDELATVNRVSRALTEKLEFKELFNLVGDQIQEVFQSNIAYLAILNSKTNIINFPYQYGDTMEPLKYGEGLTSKIISTGESLLINRDISREYDDMGINRVGKNAASYLGVPIPVEDKIIGVLSVQSTETENRFNDNDKRLLNTIARHVGIALHNAELYEEAKEAKAHAEEANETKSAFLSTVSHELRTPLTSVLGFAKIIKKRLEERIFPKIPTDDAKTTKTMRQVTENLNVVVSEGERLTKLINDVLDLAKIESGKVEWNFQPIFMQDVINRATASTTSLFEQKNLELKTNIQSDLPLVNGDQDKMIQVMVNLLSNAVKFTDEGFVSIKASREENEIKIEVQDTGIGIAEEDREKVFERFRQVGDTLTDKPQGTGLGLPICKEILEHHGGSIEMKSKLGKGSTFSFSIPILGEGGYVKPVKLERVVESLKRQIAHVSKPTNGKEHTILVVDDDTPIRSLLRQELTEAGYEVKEAANGKAALDMVRTSRPDLILLDVMMPEMNGFDVAAVLKNDPDTMDIPIIILSIVEDKERGFNIGVDRYLTKPIDTAQLFKEVSSLLAQGVSNKKVMVVDDDGNTVKTLSDVLKKRGYTVVESDGNDILEKARSAQPDIIMLSSVQNGNTEVVKTLRFEKGLENVLFLVYQ